MPKSIQAQPETLAAVDLGSNSFRLQVGRVDGNQIYPLDGLKESVRLAAGLTAGKILDSAAQERGIVALKLFACHGHQYPAGGEKCL